MKKKRKDLFEDVVDTAIDGAIIGAGIGLLSSIFDGNSPSNDSIDSDYSISQEIGGSEFGGGDFGGAGAGGEW